MQSIKFILPYFGVWPFWTSLFMQSCRHNPDVNWLVITDAGVPDNCPDNVEVREMTFSNYCRLVSDKLQVDYHPSRPYKLCDLKPMYGFVHEDDLADYDFWGFCDLDVIFGDIRKFLTAEVLESDLISCHETRVSGHFSLFRNNQIMREAFRSVENWSELLCSDENQRLDESAFSRLFISRKNLPSWLRNLLPGGHKIRIRSYFKEQYSTPDCRVAWEDGSRNFPSQWYWRKGKLTNNSSENEFLYFHFLYWKQQYWKPSYREEGGHGKTGEADFFSANSELDAFMVNQGGFYHVG